MIRYATAVLSPGLLVLAVGDCLAFKIHFLHDVAPLFGGCMEGVRGHLICSPYRIGLLATCQY